MRSNDSILPITCPHCQHELARLTICSLSILTVTCANCAYLWAVELASIPEPVRAAAQIRVLEGETHH